MKTLGYYNGKIGPLEEMSIPMGDRVCWFGDGVYDAHLCRNYRIYDLKEHINRFFNSAALLDIKMPITKYELADLIYDLVKKMDTGDLFVYYQVTRGTGERTHEFGEGPANLWIMLKPQEINFDVGPIQVITMQDTRYLHCNIKTLNLIPSVMAIEKARKEGCQEVIFYRDGGRVTECARSNVSIIKDGKLITAPTDNLILPGISRAHLIEACIRNGIAVSEVPYKVDDLYEAEEIIITSSSHPFQLVNEIDGMPVGGKKPEIVSMLEREIVEEFMKATNI